MDRRNVTTQAGRIVGMCVDGVLRWLGIPYAQADRFAAPVAPQSWAGERDATMPAPQCPQMYGNSAKRARLSPPAFDENCLTLNIYAPESRLEGERLPVYVWIHGGAFVAGSGNPYDGTHLARMGGIIVVTINYRLGVLGFVNFGDALDDPSIPSNLGLRDQIAALQWVRDNIEAFGGDPSHITIGGQSAGSMSVALLLHAPLAHGLFQQAIMQSGATSLIHSRTRSEAIGRNYVTALGLKGAKIEDLRALDLRRLFEAQAAAGAANPGTVPAAPWLDGDLVPPSLEALHQERAAAVPLMAGATGLEIRLFELMPGDILPTSWSALETLLEDQLGSEASQRIVKAYPRTTTGRRALASDLAFAMSTRHFADRHAAHSPTWFYRFDYAHPIAGATHGLDLTLTWPMRGLRAALARGGPMTGRRAVLGQRMTNHIAHFVRHGSPADDWPRYTPDSGQTMLFNLVDRVEACPDAERWRAWNGADVGPALAS
ncbi:carboxylesterase family protein [Sphingobium sp. BYY-5]|uniref:carboxylesterase/lipase family protein n=1 Tax=Sphingobium sp. BYY-5 TaxID=2926400 RepID=UPI001FA7F8F5|nr:carboxylesterase family protein [Sphingobium sp. BYY-5]MCI4591995.1 carboxylesterase family protein [Sphingobium sp. BYY-5]